MIDVVILAGGFGTRLKSVSGDTPKPMVDIKGLPFLYRLMQYLEAQGANRIVLSLHYKAEAIIAMVLKDSPVGCEIDFVVEEEPLGTGGAIKRACNKVNSDSFIVLNGDTYCELDYNAFIDASRDSDIQISGVEVQDVSRYGSLDIDKERNVIEIVEKGRSGPGVINSGTYFIRKECISNFSMEKFSFESDFLPSFEGVFKAFVSEPYFIDIGVPEDYYRACEKFK